MLEIQCFLANMELDLVNVEMSCHFFFSSLLYYD